MFKSRIGKLFIAAFTTITILMMVESYDDAKSKREMLYLAKEKQLTEVATLLSEKMPLSVREAMDTNINDLDDEQKTLELNSYLQPVVLDMCIKFPNVGMGYYSRKLDRNVAVGPSYDPSFLRKVNAPKALDIYNTGRQLSLIIDKSILWGGKPIIAIHHPLMYNGRIIGHAFANSKIEDIESAFIQSVIIRLLIQISVWLLVITFVFYFYLDLKQALKRLIRSIQTEDYQPSLSSNFPELQPLLETVVLQRDKIRRDTDLLKWLTNETAECVKIINTDKKIIFMNKAARRFHDIDDAADIVGKDFRSLLAKDHIPEWESVLIQGLNGEFCTNSKLIRRDRVLLVDVTPIRNPLNGEVVAAGGVYRDITEEENKEKALKESHERLETMIDICPFPFLELDACGSIVRLNTAMMDFYKQYLPYDIAELVGKSIRNISDELGIDYGQSFISQVLGGNEIRNKFLERLNKSWLVSGVPLRSPINGELTGAFLVYQDITEYEMYKNEMARLEYLNAIGETASSVAHELRNPATTIRGFVQLMSIKKNQDDEKYYALILDEIDRMNEIIEEFLSLSRNRFIEKTVCNANTIIMNMYPLIHADAIKNDIELRLDLCDDINSMEANAKELRQLILNLVRNSIEAMKPKGVLTISSRNVEQGITVTVSDTGLGIEEATLKHIFEPFYTSKRNGTGLGLSVCKNIVEGHGGRIDVESIVGQGTMFSAFFPASLAAKKRENM